MTTTRRRDSVAPPPMSKFSRLALTHALMVGGDAAMVIALADSFFFSVDLDAARTQVMLFLAVSFAPFLFIAPLIGPLIDRLAGGRRLVIQAVAVLRTLLVILMARYVDSVALFPLVFFSLVLQKTYIVSKSAIVPSTVRSEDELVEANAKLGLIAGLTGAVAIVPAAILLQLGGASTALVYSAVLFACSFIAATRLSPDVVASRGPDRTEQEQLHSTAIMRGAVAMTVLRASVGFIFFHLAFWLRSQDQGTVWFAAAVGASALAVMLGNALAPRIRTRVREERMLTATLGIATAAGVGLALVGSVLAGVVLAAILNFVAALGRLSFESIVQRDAPEANQGRAFAQFETRFQLAWALAAFIAVAIQVQGAVGFLIVGILAGGTLLNLMFGGPLDPASGAGTTSPVRRRSRGRRGRARGRAPRSRSTSEPPRHP
jgi:MFS family permease